LFLKDIPMENFTNDLWIVLHNYYISFVKILPRIGIGVVIFILALMIAGQVRKLLLTRLLSHTHDSLLTGFLAQISYWILIILGLSMALGAMGFEGAVTKILAGAGLSAFILGFALKDIGENFLAGILLAFKRPFKIGDLVETQGVHGRVIGLNLRETIIKTLDGKDVFIPNGGILKSPLYNYSVDNYLRLEFTVNLANKENTTRAIALIHKTLLKTDGILNEPGRKPVVSINESKEDILLVKVCFWIQSNETENASPAIKTEAIQNVLGQLQKHGFSKVPVADEPTRDQS
jgi:small conductance mechanosensitive channel